VNTVSFQVEQYCRATARDVVSPGDRAPLYYTGYGKRK
jgi:hypothetical protein